MPASRTRLPQTDQQRNHRMLFLGMLIWFLQLNVLNALTSLSCTWHWLQIPTAGLTSLQWVELIISLIASVAIAYMVYAPWRNWRKLERRKPARNPDLLTETQEDRGAMLAFLTMGVNAFFFMFAIATFVPIFALRACGQG